MSLVCPHCQHVVVRTDRDLVNLGKVADVVFNDSALAHGDGGVFQGRSFIVHGRVVMQHPQGGTWEEYYAIFDGQPPSWIEEAMGRWYVLQQVPAAAPPLEGLVAGSTVDLGSYGRFTVDEASEGTFLSAEGELPFSAAPGTVRRFADLSAPDGARASLQQVDGSPEITVFVGIETTFDALGVYRRSGERAEHAVATGEIKCPNCGGPLPARKDPKAERFACAYCGALADVATLSVITKQDVSRLSPAIPLGTEGTFDEKTFTVIGYVTRTIEVDGETYGWEEFLLYNADRGYKWLICDEGSWLIGQAIAGGEVDTERFPDAVRYDGKRFNLRNTGSASVTHVLGEFYWQVSIGETVLAHDFECGKAVVSREASGTEVNWTRSQSISVSDLERAFGITLGRTYASSTATDAEPDGVPSASSNGMTIFKMIVAFLILLAFIRSCQGCQGCTSTDGDGSYSTSGRGAGGSGGLGGMGGK